MKTTTQTDSTAPKDSAPKYWSTHAEVSETGPPRYI